MNDATQRRWSFVVPMALLAAAIFAAHRLIIPLGVCVTRHAPRSCLDKIEGVSVFPFVFTALLLLRRQLGRSGSFFAGTVIALGATDFLEGMRLTGWSAFSHPLSSWPIMAVAIVVMTQKSLDRRLPSAFAGFVALFVFWVYNVDAAGVRAQTPAPSNALSTTLSATPLLPCGNTSLRIRPRSLEELPSLITVEECGFSPGLARVSGEHINIQNKLAHPLQIHIYYPNTARLLHGLTTQLASGEKRSIKLPAQGVSSFAFVVSDPNVALGMSAILWESPAETWQIGRQPLRALVEAQP